ncbi:pentapeptide repeat-containing protein [Streptomyces sp. NP-1717]|uniref:pentapeptide repeat-containing protein n=1 Tax=Streptomyces sp. NP-1717 TaxID=2704470 RepID=UPI001F5D1482|nr:pentapeptide repeat-containing protein [Streptomyces sp. NP-1717]MCI3220884.1 pentapeptide repeat-containing protein [Streptomyces sp. NP-1717]
MPEDPIGCRGIRVSGHGACLAHLADADRAIYLSGLAPGSGMDHRGTPFTEPLLVALLSSVRDPVTGKPVLGAAQFGAATFDGMADFGEATFSGAVGFGAAIFKGATKFAAATFEGGADFTGAVFHHHAGFKAAIFESDARFPEARFQDIASFQEVTFHSLAGFRAAVFRGDCRFRKATFGYETWFRAATFNGNAGFRKATFRANTGFEGANFRNDALFEAASFERGAWFRAANFGGDGLFGSVTFMGNAGFRAAVFRKDARFENVTFERNAWFKEATFKGAAHFEQATFGGAVSFSAAAFGAHAGFVSAVFDQPVTLGPMLCEGRMTLSGAAFHGPMNLLLAARHLTCRRTRWSSTAELRLRHATVDFTQAVFELPLTIAAEADPFLLADGAPVAENGLAGGPEATVRMASVRGVDAAHLILADVDLTECLFAGTVHLDQLRLEGDCAFAGVPVGVHRRRGRPVRFTRRRTLAEERHWRSRQPGAIPGWNTTGTGAGSVGPAQLAPVYRALRKAFEDGKNEPGAADFYYGEMEMRRQDRANSTRAERALLHGYWLLSGYGLRASRALGWLAAALLVTVVLLTGIGIPREGPKQEATGMVPAGGGKVTFEIDHPDPQPPVGDRFTGERFEKALNVTLNSVVFRSAGQDLTTAGKYIEMTSRLTEPLLLGLAVLAVRSRVKR